LYFYKLNFKQQKKKKKKLKKSLTTSDMFLLFEIVAVHRVHSLFADAGQVYIGPVLEHLTQDIIGLDHSPGRLTQVVQRRLAAKHLGKSSGYCGR
jgi:hypothetical protein